MKLFRHTESTEMYSYLTENQDALGKMQDTDGIIIYSGCCPIIVLNSVEEMI